MSESERLQGIIGVLEPLEHLDYHGKWRIQRALALARGDEPPATMRDMAPYGYCPIKGCNASGVTREKRPGGNDTCRNGHTYPSADALPF